MGWEEKQRKKMINDLSAGKITVEQYNEMNSALGKTYDKQFHKRACLLKGDDAYQERSLLVATKHSA